MTVTCINGYYLNESITTLVRRLEAAFLVLIDTFIL